MLAKNAQNYKDELDELKNENLKIERLEIKMIECNLKLENVADLKIQMKQIEENNLKYIIEKVI